MPGVGGMISGRDYTGRRRRDPGQAGRDASTPAPAVAVQVQQRGRRERGQTTGKRAIATLPGTWWPNVIGPVSMRSETPADGNGETASVVLVPARRKPVGRWRRAKSVGRSGMEYGLYRH